MNLFNPKGQKNLEISYTVGDKPESPARSNYMGTIQEILATDGPDRVRMRNQDLQ
jgi:hypothetical protein